MITPFKDDFKDRTLHMALMGLGGLQLGLALYCMVTIGQNDLLECEYRADWLVTVYLMVIVGFWINAVAYLFVELKESTHRYLFRKMELISGFNTSNFMVGFPIMVLMQLRCDRVKTASLIVYWVIYILFTILSILFAGVFISLEIIIIT